MTSGINIAVPAISDDFHADPVLISWAVTAYLLVIGILLIPSGRIGDIIGIKKVFFWGTVVFTLTSIILVFANSVAMLIGGRALQGIGSGMIFATGTAIITATSLPSQRGRNLGIFISSIYIGYLAGPFLGGILTEHFGWRSMFVINIPAGLLVIILMLWKVKGDWAHSQGEKFDYIGSAVCAAALVALIYGLSILPDYLGMVLVVIGLIGIFAFFKWEKRNSSPLLNPEIFHNNKALVFSNISTLIVYGATFAITFLLEPLSSIY